MSSRYHSVACRGELRARARRGVVDLVVDVGDVVDERHLVAARAAATSAATCRRRTAARCRRERARRRSGRRSTSAPARAAAAARRATSCRCQRAASILRSVSSRGSAAITDQSSGPLSRPVKARRTARRLPPTAFSSRTIAFAASLSSAAVRALAQLAEALERRALVRQRDRRAGVRSERASSRASFRSPAARDAAPARPTPRERARRRARSTSTAEPVAEQRRASEDPACRGPDAHRRPTPPASDVEAPSRPSCAPATEPRRPMRRGRALRAERLGERRVQRLVGPMVVAAKHVA